VARWSVMMDVLLERSKVETRRDLISKCSKYMRIIETYQQVQD